MITFRTAPPDAKMERVYTIQQIVVADPTDIEGTCKVESTLRDRIAGYVAEAKPARVFAKLGKYRFYIFTDTPILLPHAPAPIQASKGAIYFSLAELQSGKPETTPLPVQTYREKLLDERWLAKREKIKQNRGEKCELCGSTEQLELHHGYYSPFLEPWDYHDGTLWVLCRNCHDENQRLLTSIHMPICFTHPRELDGLKRRVVNAASEVQFGISADEADEILREESKIQATLYADYTAEITSCSELGGSIAEELERLAVKEFPGIEVSVVHRERDRDGNVYVEGPEPAVVDRIQAFLDREREKRG